jgi:hypothetical protein
MNEKELPEEKIKEPTIKNIINKIIPYFILIQSIWHYPKIQ